MEETKQMPMFSGADAALFTVAERRRSRRGCRNEMPCEVCQKPGDNYKLNRGCGKPIELAMCDAHARVCATLPVLETPTEYCNVLRASEHRRAAVIEKTIAERGTGGIRIR